MLTLNLPILKLYFLPRLELYADSYEEYCLRREIYINYDIELPRRLAQNCDWNKIDSFLSNIKDS